MVGQSKILFKTGRLRLITVWSVMLIALLSFLGLGLVFNLGSAKAAPSLNLTVVQQNADGGMTHATKFKITVTDSTKVSGAIKYRALAARTSCSTLRTYTTDLVENNSTDWTNNSVTKTLTSGSGGLNADHRYLCARVQHLDDANTSTYQYSSVVATDLQGPSFNLSQGADGVVSITDRAGFSFSDVYYANLSDSSGDLNQDITVSCSFNSSGIAAQSSTGNYPSTWQHSGSNVTWKRPTSGYKIAKVANQNHICVIAKDSRGNKAVKGIALDTTAPVINNDTHITQGTQSPFVSFAPVDEANGSGIAKVGHKFVDKDNDDHTDCSAMTGYNTVDKKTIEINTANQAATKDALCFLAVDKAGNKGYSARFTYAAASSIFVRMTRGQTYNDYESPWVNISLNGGSGNIQWGYSNADGCSTTTVTADNFPGGNNPAFTALSANEGARSFNHKMVLASTPDDEYCIAVKVGGSDYRLGAIRINPTQIDNTNPDIEPPTLDRAKAQITITATDAGTGLDVASWRYSDNCPTTRDMNRTTVGNKSTPRMDAKGKVTINVNTSHNGKRFCFWVLDRVGNEGFNDLEIAADAITKRQPDLVVTQSGNNLNYRHRNDNLHYAGPLTTDPTCNTLATNQYRSGKPNLEESDNGKYYCFRAGASTSDYSYVKLRISAVDKTPPVISIIQTGNRITAKDTNSETSVRWWYFKTTTTTEPTTTCTKSYDWTDTKKRALGDSVTLTKSDSNKWICFRAVDAAGNSNVKRQQISPITDDTTPPVDSTKPYVAPAQAVQPGSVVNVTKTNLPAGAKVATAATAAGSWVWVYNDKDIACNSSHEHYKRLKDRKKGQVGQSLSFSFSQFPTAKSVCFLGIDTNTKREYFVGYRISSDGSTTPPPPTTPKDDTVKQIVASLPSGVTAISWVWVYTSDAPHACNRDHPLYQTHIKPKKRVGPSNKIDPNKWPTNRKAFCVVAVGSDGNEYFFGYDRLGNATGTDVQTLDGSNVTPTPTPTPDPGGEETPDPGGEETPDPGGEETPDPGGEETPDPGGEETPDPGGEETPDPGGEETPGTDAGDGTGADGDGEGDDEGGSNIIWFIVAGVAIVAIIIVLITTSGSRQQRRE